MRPRMGDAPSCVSGLHARFDCPLVRTTRGPRTGHLGRLARPGRSRPGGGGLTWLLFRPLRCVVSAFRRRRRGLVRVGRQVQGVVGGPGRDRDRGRSRPRRTHKHSGAGVPRHRSGQARQPRLTKGRAGAGAVCTVHTYTHSGAGVPQRRREPFRERGRPEEGGPSKEQKTRLGYCKALQCYCKTLHYCKTLQWLLMIMLLMLLLFYLHPG